VDRDHYDDRERHKPPENIGQEREYDEQWQDRGWVQDFGHLDLVRPGELIGMIERPAVQPTVHGGHVGRMVRGDGGGSRVRDRCEESP